MKTVSIKIGDVITANVMGTIIAGTVTGTGTHKGQFVADIHTEERDWFVYARQIITVNGIAI